MKNQTSKPKLSCLGIDCPERKSLCCGAGSEEGSNGIRFVCSECKKEYVGGECNGLAAIWKTVATTSCCHDKPLKVCEDCNVCPDDYIDWEKQFDNKFGELCEYDDFRDTWVPRHNIVKSFIYDLINKRELPPAIGVSQFWNYGEKYHYTDFWKKKIITDLLQRIEGIEPGIKWMQEGSNKNRKGYTNGFNECLDIVIKILKEN